MLEGETEYGCAGASYLMTMGDSLQLDGQVPHGGSGLTTLPVRFLSVTVSGQPPG
jgi:quercetin dioxygenase-like cupin family protein